MELSNMISQMCHEVLTSADISAIRKARGFKQKEASSRSTFENFFLSSIGLNMVMASLSPEEVACLHLLNQQKDAVDISFFERVYGSARNGSDYYYGTFTQQFKETLDEVKKTLVRKGVLVMAEARLRGESVQMQRWRFCFPPEFAPYLPPLIPSPHRSDAQGLARGEAARHRLLEALGSLAVPAQIVPGSYAIYLEQGSLKMDDHAFRASDLLEWQQAAWEAPLAGKKSEGSTAPLPTTALQAILNTLGPGEWAGPGQIEPALKIFCFGVKQPNAAKICEAGWKWGCLAKCTQGKESFYRMPSSPPSAFSVDPSTYLRVSLTGGAALVDLRSIAFDALEQLNHFAFLDMRHKQMVASPDVVKIGRAAPEERQSPLAGWLRAHIPAFEQALEAVDARWGKTIIHSDLLVARVRDLSLRVQLERALGTQLQVLDSEYIAFPRAWRSEVEKTLKKGGFVVKEVRA